MFLFVIYVLTVPVLVLVFAVYFTALLWKCIVWLAMKAKFGRHAVILPGVDAISQFPLLKVDEAANNVIIRIAGPLSVADARRRFSERLMDLKTSDGRWKHPKMRQYFTEFMGYQIALEDPDFNLDEHFGYYFDCQENAVTYRDDDDLTTIMEDLMNTKVTTRLTMAPWRIFILPRRDYREHVILVKADHAIFDAGAASMVLFPTITDENTAETFQNTKNVPLWVRIMYHIRGLMILPYGTFMQLFSEQDFNPIHRHDREAASGKYLAFPVEVPLRNLNEIRRATDVKINSIMVTCVFRAVTRFAEEKYGPAEKPKWTWTCHQPISMWMPGDDLELINRISAVATPLPGFSSTISPLEHLQSLKAYMDAVFVTDAIWSGYTFLKFGINTIPKCITVPLARRSFTHPTLGLSNIKGSDVGYKAFGHPITLMTGFLPLIKTWDLGIVVTSYDGEMAISVTGRKSAFSSAEEIKTIQRYIVEEIDNLHRGARQLSKEASAQEAA